MLTALAVVFTASMVFIRADLAISHLGLPLLALTAACGGLASVPTTRCCGSCPPRRRRVASLGWAGRPATAAVCCALLIYTGFIMGDGPTAVCST